MPLRAPATCCCCYYVLLYSHSHHIHAFRTLVTDVAASFGIHKRPDGALAACFWCGRCRAGKSHTFAFSIDISILPHLMSTPPHPNHHTSPPPQALDTMARKKPAAAPARGGGGGKAASSQAARKVVPNSTAIDLLPLHTIEGALARLKSLADTPESFCAPPPELAEVCVCVCVRVCEVASWECVWCEALHYPCDLLSLPHPLPAHPAFILIPFFKPGTF